MSDLEIVAVSLLAAWLVMLTLATVLLVRQVALLSVRVSLPMGSFSLEDDGPELGSPVPPEVEVALGESGEQHHLLILSASCAPCRRLAAALDGTSVNAPIVALITGPAELARAITDLLPGDVVSVYDPEASALVGELGVQSRPFAITIEGETVTRKTYLRGEQDLLSFVRHEAGAAQGIEEVAHVY